MDNKSSLYDPTHSGAVRRDGSYIYEEFLATGGTDVKVGVPRHHALCSASASLHLIALC